MGKFQATIKFPVGDYNNQYNLEDCDIKIDCPELKKWWESGKPLGFLNSRKKIHLFENPADLFSICGMTCRNYTSEPSFLVMGGRKYTVCLKCRKIAQGEES